MSEKRYKCRVLIEDCRRDGEEMKEASNNL